MFYSKRVTASLLALALGVMADSINNLKEMASLEVMLLPSPWMTNNANLRIPRAVASRPPG